MSKHLKMIVSANNGPRKEVRIEGGGVMTLSGPIQAHSALYGDGKERYLDVTTAVQEFGDVWPEDWEELVYGQGRQAITDGSSDARHSVSVGGDGDRAESALTIHSAHYGIGGDDDIDVREQLQSLVQNGSLDLTVTNDSLNAGNPFRGQKKRLRLTYSYDGGEPVTIERGEREWLIVGQASGNAGISRSEAEKKMYDDIDAVGQTLTVRAIAEVVPPPMTAPALTDLLIRRFKIPDRRLRGPMPIDLRDFHRNDLAKLFAELGFTKGVEVGVAEGHYSEVLCKSIPNLELLCVDPWHRYSGNPWAHSQEHQDFSKAETERKLKGYNAKLIQDYSMNAVRDVPEGSLDFCYIDGHHGFDWVMQDLIEWGKRVRSGGIIAGDDFYHFKKSWAGVVQAVQAYTDAHKIGLWFLVDAPQSVDFFWVKP